MSNNKFRTLIVAMLMLAVITTCTKIEQGDPDPKSIENQLQIMYKTGPEIRVGELLTLVVKNHSDQCVIFPKDFGIKIITSDTEIEIENLVLYTKDQDLYLMPSGDINDAKFIDASPNIREDEYPLPLELNLVIQGQLCEKTDIKIVKYIPFKVVK